MPTDVSPSYHTVTILLCCFCVYQIEMELVCQNDKLAKVRDYLVEEKHWITFSHVKHSRGISFDVCRWFKNSM